MLRLKLDGYSYNHIGELAGISRQRVQQLLSPPIAVRRIIVKAYNGHCAACDIYVGYGGHQPDRAARIAMPYLPPSQTPFAAEP